MTNQKLYIVTLQAGPDTFKELLFAADMDDAKTIAELRFANSKCVNVRRAASHPTQAAPVRTLRVVARTGKVAA